jgi:hypothetical protein
MVVSCLLLSKVHIIARFSSTFKHTLPTPLLQDPRPTCAQMTDPEGYNESEGLIGGLSEVYKGM